MKKIKNLAPILIFLIGASIFLYPEIANRIAIYYQSQEIHSYNATMDSLSLEKIHDLKSDAETYNENLAGDPVHDPFILGSGYVLPDDYLNILNIDGFGTMGYIDIPSIDVHIPIYHGTSDEVLAKGVGHIEGTSLPIGGKYRHSILCAHRGLPNSELFTRLDELEKGDLFYIHILNEVHAYEIDEINIVLPENINECFYPVPSLDLITLMTCTPYGVNTHRLLVRGHRIEYEPELQNEKNNNETPLFIILFILFLLLFFVILIFYYMNKFRGR